MDFPTEPKFGLEPGQQNLFTLISQEVGVDENLHMTLGDPINNINSILWQW